MRGARVLCGRLAALALVLAIGCSSEGEPSVGSVALLPGDPAPPTFSASALLIDLTDAEREEIARWVDSLPRPALSDCSTEDYSAPALGFAIVGISAEGRPNCQATFEDVAACAVAVDECTTTFDSPDACGAFEVPECKPDAPID